MAGYSGKPLEAKLGIKPGMKVYVDGAPPSFELAAPHVTRLPKQAEPLASAWVTSRVGGGRRSVAACSR